MPDRMTILSRQIVTALLGVLLIGWFLPLSPVLPTAELDSSWRLGLAVACEQQRVVGVDLVFTFGPLGCLVTWQYWPATYLPSLALWLLIGYTATWLTFHAANGWAERLRGAAALALLGLTPDSALVALPIAFVWHGWHRGEMTIAVWVACFTLGALALTKFTLLPLSALALAAGLAMRRIGLTQTAVGLGLAASGFVVALAWAGQPWQSLSAFLGNAAEVARHYPDAMQWPASVDRVHYSQIAAVSLLLVAAATSGLVALSAAFRDEKSIWARISWIAFAFGTIALLVRHGSIRGDAPHLLPAFLCLAAWLLLVLPPSGTRLRRLCSLMLVALLLLALVMQDKAAVNLPGGSIAQRVLLSMRGGMLVLTGQDPRDGLNSGLETFAAALGEQVGKAWPQGRTVDFVSYDQFLLLAGKPDHWRSRPIIQSYSAYSPALTLLNARFLRSARAPESLVVAAQTIDDRLLTMDDAAIWEVIRRNYRVTGRLATGHLVLARRESETASEVTDATSRQVLAEDWVPLPSAEGRSLYASARWEATWVERFVAIVWKPPARFLELRMASGEMQRYRWIRAAGEGGFLLAPLIRDTESLALWLSGSIPDAVPPTAMRIVDATGQPVRATVSFGSYPYPIE